MKLREQIPKTGDLTLNGVAFGSGVLMALLWTLLSAALRVFEFFSFNLEHFLGSLVFPGLNSSWAFVLGVLIHLFMGGVFGASYGVIFRLVGLAGVGPGLLLSGLHYLFALFLLNGLAEVHPAYSGSNILSLSTWLSLLVFHGAFGSFVGAAYRQTASQVESESKQRRSLLFPMKSSRFQS